MNYSRRTFIKVTSLASTTLLPVISSLTKVFGEKPEDISNLLQGSFNSDLEFHILNNNLLNLHFYFINVERKSNCIIADAPEQNSFMIVRLPQMHISEKGFWEEDWNSIKIDKKFPNATLSGYSYLAFQLWPDKITVNQQGQQIISKQKDKQLEFTLENILNWNDENIFDLITLVEWFDLKKINKFEFDFRDFTKKPCDEFKNSKLWSKTVDEINKEFNSDYYIKNVNEPEHNFNYRKYKSLIKNFLDQNFTSTSSKNSFIPITFLEIPQSLCLVPISGVRDENGKLLKVPKKFWKNKLVGGEEVKEGYRKYEVWNNTLFYKSGIQSINKDADKSFRIEAPSFRAIGLISNDFNCFLSPQDCETQKETNYLPSLLDKAELVFLTQFAKQSKSYDFTQMDFDIKEMNGLFFTGLGVITHLKYYNIEKCPIDKGIDLIEYEQIITQGRDIFIRVARLGYNSKTGQRYKHIIEGKRRIETDENNKYKIPLASFIELKQYCECIDKHIDYTNNEVNDSEWNAKFNPISTAPKESILSPINSNKCDYKRNIFKELTVIEKKRIPIRCLYKDKVQVNDTCSLQWFWPTKEGATVEGDRDIDVSYSDYLLCEYESKDWSDTIIKAQTPFIFLRASYLADNNIDEANSDYFKGDFFAKLDPADKLIRDHNIIERRKTFFNSQKISFTPSLTEKVVNKNWDPDLQKKVIQENLNASKSKTNILETEFIEHYFRVKNKNAFEFLEDGITRSIEKTKYVIFPQVLRAKVFIDHIKDLTQKKISSVIEYHEDYIDHGFKETIDETTKKYANGGKLILANTEAYINDKEELVNNNYNEIKNALQEAKDKLGNLAVPDIIPDTISLEKFGVTLPKKISTSIEEGKTVLSQAQDTLNKIASFNPRTLLRGKLSDVCGLDLTAILDELIPADSANNQTPLFEINKILNKVEGEILNSSVYKDITNFTIPDPLDSNFRKSPAKLISDYDKRINELRITIETARLDLNGKIKKLSNEIPNADELNNLVKSLFEKYRTKVFKLEFSHLRFEEVFNEIEKIKEDVILFFEDEKNILKEEFYSNQKLLKDYFIYVSKELRLLPTELEGIDGDSIEHYLETKLKVPYYDTTDFCGYLDKIINLFDTISDTKPIDVDGAKIYYVIGSDKSVSSITYELTNDDTKGIPLLVFNNVASGKYIQIENKINTLKAFVIKNIDGNTFQHRAAVKLKDLINDYTSILANVENQVKNHQEKLSKIIENIQEWKRNSNKYLERFPNISSSIKDSILKVQGLILKVIPYVDFLRKFDPYFYIKEQERLRKEVEDIEGRFKQKYYDEYITVTSEIESKVFEYNNNVKNYVKALNQFEADKLVDNFNKERDKFQKFKTNLIGELNKKSIDIIEKLKDNPKYKQAKQIYDEINVVKEKIKKAEKDLKDYLDNYMAILQKQAEAFTKELDKKVIEYLHEREMELIDAVGADNILAIQSKINEAKNIYRLLTSIKQQELRYNWNTTSFKDINLGIVSFKKFSDTKLSIDVKATTYFTSGKFPPAIERIVTFSENRFTNFGISFFNSITIGFKEISFIAGSDHSTHFDIKIKDVKFDGALSFVQAFEKWLQTIGKGLILQLNSDNVKLGYSLPLPAIKTPGFSFFNLSLNFDLRLYFDNRPLRFGFSLARPESKFGIAVGIYAGFGYFGIVVDPKKGIVELECSLEAGAWAGISLGGMISGEVKLAFGFTYTKNEFGVSIEGHIVAEGRLSFWIMEIAARIYLSVVSKNSYVEGSCTVTYSVKLGFIKKSFSGSFHRKIAGANSNNSGNQSAKILDFQNKVALQFGKSNFDINKLHHVMTSVLDSYDSESDEMETYPVSFNSWKQFITIF